MRRTIDFNFTEVSFELPINKGALVSSQHPIRFVLNANKSLLEGVGGRGGLYHYVETHSEFVSFLITADERVLSFSGFPFSLYAGSLKPVATVGGLGGEHLAASGANV